MLKAAIIGAGFISEFHGDAYNALEDVKLCGICDVNPEAAAKMGKQLGCTPYTDAAEMLGAVKPDLVSICVPTYLHEQYTVMALEHGANVLCEKPFALTMDSCERMAEAAKRTGLLLMTAQVLRWWPEYRTIRTELTRRGNPLFVATQRLQYASRTSWLTDPNKGGGVLFDLFVHDLDYLCSLYGTCPDVEWADGSMGDEGSWRRLCVGVRFPGGTCAKLEASNMMPAGFPFTASLRADYADACLQYRFRAPVNIQKDAKTETEFLLFADGETKTLPIPDMTQSRAFAAEIAAFTDGVKARVSPLPIEDTLNVMRVIHRVNEMLKAR